MNQLLKPTAAGLVSGLILGLFLKLIESVIGLKVYTLLLNVDYIPILKNYKLSELNEFLLHLVVSVGLSLFIHVYLVNKDWSVDQKMKFVIKLAIVVGLLLYPTTMLSERTPAVTSIYSFLFWMVGHGLYGVILGKLLISEKGIRV